MEDSPVLRKAWASLDLSLISNAAFSSSARAVQWGYYETSCDHVTSLDEAIRWLYVNNTYLLGQQPSEEIAVILKSHSSHHVRLCFRRNVADSAVLYANLVPT